MTGETYTNTFGGENINPANLSYVGYTTSVSLELVWAFEATPDDSVTADKIDVNANAIGLTITMPPANQVSVGQDVLFDNVGSQSFSVLANNGDLIANVASGVSWFLYITDNSTAAGVWRAVQFGASTSAANAAALAGAGL